MAWGTPLTFAEQQESGWCGSFLFHIDLSILRLGFKLFYADLSSVSSHGILQSVVEILAFICLFIVFFWLRILTFNHF